MKILIYITSLWSGGAERVTSILANHWVRKGHEVTIVTLATRDHDFYAVDPLVRRVPLDLLQDSTGRLSGLLANYRRLRALVEVVREEKPDIMLGMMSTAACMVALASMITGVPAVGSERNHPVRLKTERVWSWLRCHTYPRLAAVVAQTDGIADWLRQETKSSNAVVIPNPVNYPLEVQEPVKSPDIREGRNILLAVGRLAPQKAVDRLIRAFAELAAEFPAWDLVILGKGPLQESLEEQARAAGLESRISFPGAVGNVGDWYAVADVYVMTSLFEGFPNTLVEALAHGVPAVSVDCETGPKDIIRPGMDGLLVPQDDHAALVAALRQMMADENLRAHCAKHAVEVRERFSLPKVSAEWEKLFEGILARGRN